MPTAEVKSKRFSWRLFWLFSFSVLIDFIKNFNTCINKSASPPVFPHSLHEKNKTFYATNIKLTMEP